MQSFSSGGMSLDLRPAPERRFTECGEKSVSCKERKDRNCPGAGGTRKKKNGPFYFFETREKKEKKAALQPETAERGEKKKTPPLQKFAPTNWKRPLPPRLRSKRAEKKREPKKKKKILTVSDVGERKKPLFSIFTLARKRGYTRTANTRKKGRRLREEKERGRGGRGSAAPVPEKKSSVAARRSS